MTDAQDTKANFWKNTVLEVLWNKRRERITKNLFIGVNVKNIKLTFKIFLVMTVP